MRLLAKLATIGAAAGLARASFLSKKTDPQTMAGGVATCEAPCPACESCPLSSVRVGEACCLLEIGAGRRLRRRLAELGLTPGVQMTVLQNTGGPVLICVRNSRLALGRHMAHQLDVMPLAVEDI